MTTEIKLLLEQYQGVKVRDQLAQRNLIIFGAGNAGITVLNRLRSLGFNVNYFCDNDSQKWGKTIEGISVISINDLLEINQDSYYLCIASIWAKDIAIQLIDEGIHGFYDLTYWNERYEVMFESGIIHESIDKLEKVYRLLNDHESRKILLSILKYRLSLDPRYLPISEYDQYFHPKINLNNNEIIIDGGANDGAELIKFLSKIKGNSKAFAFEPEENNYRLLLANIKKHDLDQIKPIMAGLWETESISFINTGLKNGTYHYVDDKGNQEIKLTSIDTFVKREKIIPSLIKMDIEGSEIKALKGARQTIISYQPKLFICVYHKPEDLWDIPLHINSLSSSYSYYLGHHNHSYFETVLYCFN